MLIGGEPPLVLTAPPPAFRQAGRSTANLAPAERVNKPPAKQELDLKHGMSCFLMIEEQNTNCKQDEAIFATWFQSRNINPDPTCLLCQDIRK